MRDARDVEQRLEALLAQAVRQLPMRRAPSTLAARVLGVLEQRAAWPWWRRSFAYWPQPVRVGFLLACCGLGALAFSAGEWLLRMVSVTPKTMPGLALMRMPMELLSALGHALPQSWLYEGAILCAVLYAMLFGFGAAAYRLLYLHR